MEKLTNQEEEIMLRIWQLGRCAVKQIMELLPEPRPPYTTVASIVNNLKRKEYVKAEPLYRRRSAVKKEPDIDKGRGRMRGEQSQRRHEVSTHFKHLRSFRFTKIT